MNRLHLRCQHLLHLLVLWDPWILLNPLNLMNRLHLLVLWHQMILVFLTVQLGLLGL